MDEEWQRSFWYLTRPRRFIVPCLQVLYYPGNEKGEVILFEPTTSDNVSCRTIFDPITVLAPAADCRTYAIGCVTCQISGCATNLI